MDKKFQPNCLPLLIGSLPMDDHIAAIELVLAHTWEIPLWVQLPSNKAEGMLLQFLPGMPGLTVEGDNMVVNTSGDAFDEALLRFYEEYISVLEGDKDLLESRFALSPDIAEGFYVFLKKIAALPSPPAAVKGQITGPISFCTGVHNQQKTAIFYDERARDAGVKLLAQKARYQVRKLSRFGCPVILFIDEPALAGFGSSEFISISKEDVSMCIEEVIEAIHAEGGLAGIHICANTDWSIILDSSVDIVNFDAYAYFDRFILYPEQLKKFIASGRIIAWGIVPTLKPEDVERESAESLLSQWEEKVRRLEDLGIDRDTLMAQSFITPACGTGSIRLDLAQKVLRLTREVSDAIRRRM